MNHIYRVIFDRRLGRFRVASELAKGCGKGSGTATVAGAALAFLATSFFPAQAVCTVAFNDVTCDGAAPCWRRTMRTAPAT
ncbi:hypothetical protein D9M72_215100 [compost metagenome]